jgi:DNA-directed RNA polymerase specialized sigma24 family protein
MPSVRRRARPRLAFQPTWNKAIRGYAYNLTRSFWPQLQPFHEWEDLTQESYLVFDTCARRYKNKVDNGAWFMALFKIALRNRLLDLVARAPKYSLVEDVGLLVELGAPDQLCALYEVLEGVPAAEKLVLWDLCRTVPRHKVSRQAAAQARAALVGAHA